MRTSHPKVREKKSLWQRGHKRSALIKLRKIMLKDFPGKIVIF